MVLWIKAVHVVAVISWMAGLLYLPRLYVYHCAAEKGSKQSETFKVMEQRLLTFIMNPAVVGVWATGGSLAVGQIRPGAAADRLPPRAWRLAQRLRRGLEHPQPALLPPHERGADASHDRDRGAGDRQAVLGPIAPCLSPLPEGPSGRPLCHLSHRGGTGAVSYT